MKKKQQSPLVKGYQLFKAGMEEEARKQILKHIKAQKEYAPRSN